MSHPPDANQFKANPVEILILLLTGIVFVHSSYNLLYLHHGFHPKVLSKMASEPLTEGRHLASIPSLVELNVPCQPSFEEKTGASKVKLNGSLCSYSRSGNPSGNKIEAEMINKTNSVQATVFLNETTEHYSTEYFSLVPGANSIRLRIIYPDRTSFTQEITISKVGSLSS